MGGQIPWVTVGVVAALLAFRFIRARNAPPVRLRVERLWIRPTLLGLVCVAALVALPPPGGIANWAVLILAASAGAGLGWQRGRLTVIDVHPEDHTLRAQASPLATLVVGGLLVFRVAVRGTAVQDASALGLSTGAISEALLLLVGAMVVAQNAEMWLRARRVLETAREAGVVQTPAH